MKVKAFQIRKKRVPNPALILIFCFCFLQWEGTAQIGTSWDEGDGKTLSVKAHTESADKAVIQSFNGTFGLLGTRRQIVAVSCPILFIRLESTTLEDSHKACLDTVAVKIVSEEASVVIDGHQDTSESDEEEWSLLRAINVRDYLKSKGVDAAKITVKDFVTDCPPPADAADKNNRRVKIWILPKNMPDLTTPETIMTQLDALRKCPPVPVPPRATGS